MRFGWLLCLAILLVACAAQTQPAIPLPTTLPAPTPTLADQYAVTAWVNLPEPNPDQNVILSGNLNKSRKRFSTGYLCAPDDPYPLCWHDLYCRNGLYPAQPVIPPEIQFLYEKRSSTTLDISQRAATFCGISGNDGAVKTFHRQFSSTLAQMGYIESQNNPEELSKDSSSGNPVSLSLVLWIKTNKIMI